MVMRLAAVLALAATGCDYVTGSFRTNGFSGDPFPINAEMTSGAIVIGLAEDDHPGVRSAVLDVLSPLTVIDRGAGQAVSVGDSTLTVFGATVPGGELDKPRARFSDKSVVTLHPCGADTPVCEVGTDAVPRPFDAVLGIDAFDSDALRIRAATSEIFIFPDIAGDALHRSRACDAVLPSPFRGGGTLLLGGTEISFSNRRIAIDACIGPRPDRTLPQRERGVDALLVLSTATGTSILNESTYERYRLIDPLAPELATLPESRVLLPSGPVDGRLTSLPSLALVGNLSSNPRAPCRQMWAHHLLTRANCKPAETPPQCANDLDDNSNGVINDGCATAGDAPELGAQCVDDLDNDADGAINDGCPVDDCPCTDGNVFCPVPAIVELAPATRIPVLIVSNAERTLVALRTELRPDRPEVDGILGLDAIRALELDIDYPHARLLARCVDRQACGARITLNDNDSRVSIGGCLGDQPGPFFP